MTQPKQSAFEVSSPDLPKLAIVVGGGPAPGINSVISSAAIRARLAGLDVVGVRDGYSSIMQGRTDNVVSLDIDTVANLHFHGGSFLRTSRANPTKQPETLRAAVQSLRELGVGYLVSIGGDDTAFSAMNIAREAGGSIKVVHVPKTIDNDLDLPESIPTFGYQTARHVGTAIVRDLITDAQTTSRWYFVVAMGRKAGHLALGIGKAASATITLIPEEYADGYIPLQRIVDDLCGSIIKRRAQGRNDGVAVVAEGLVERLDPAELAELEDVERDEHCHIRIAEVQFGALLKNRVQARLKQLGVSATIVDKNIGYELRCTAPIPFDMEYTRDLGYCAVKYLLEGGKDAMVTVQHGVFKPIPFAEMLDPATGKTRVRMVNIETESYKIARRYMIRLRRDDFVSSQKIEALADAARLSAEDFRRQFEYVVDSEPPPLSFDI